MRVPVGIQEIVPLRGEQSQGIFWPRQAYGKARGCLQHIRLGVSVEGYPNSTFRVKRGAVHLILVCVGAPLVVAFFHALSVHRQDGFGARHHLQPKLFGVRFRLQALEDGLQGSVKVEGQSALLLDEHFAGVLPARFSHQGVGAVLDQLLVQVQNHRIVRGAELWAHIVRIEEHSLVGAVRLHEWCSERKQEGPRVPVRLRYRASPCVRLPVPVEVLPVELLGNLDVVVPRLGRFQTVLLQHAAVVHHEEDVRVHW
mmetsp:Transcript_8359/g.23906  ORF Transcript_8359/g.23906 Transcript_8359/m.23906 type:complete len:256 (-) Transcript_8359:377-1144(-)